ncbi:Ran-binding-domain-containing protein [Aureobasidium namibiae CBS 147.97]|uniref:Ran-binding-domain-containing protein n=1 Tax=Aureobasidium namibiae CBS 147.97 TaxID=1043004 RepID=A0A074WM33_9PEZI
MDILLAKVTQQAMNYAIRSGIAITSTYAIRQCTRLVKTAPRGGKREELLNLQVRLESKIRIISPAIDMIELIAARGNTSLESAVTLTKDLRWEIQALGIRLANAANEEELYRRKSLRAKSKEQNELELQLIVSDVKKLLARIEDAVPLINLAITTSGVNLSTNLPATVSPSRLLQASTFLTAADSQYMATPGQNIQVGPVYTLSVYMLFASHTNRPHDEETAREATWKEVIHKARVKLVRVPLDSLYNLPGSTTTPSGARYFPKELPSDNSSVEYAYQLVVIEDLDDDRVHTFEEDEPQPGPFEEVALAGIRDVIPIHEISKIFYADTGKILNIGSDGETNNPILLLKRDIHAEPPRRMMERRYSEGQDYYDDDEEEDQRPQESDDTDPDDHQSQINAQILRDSTPQPQTEKKETTSRQDTDAHWRLPPDLDPEWIAFEVYSEEAPSDDEDEEEDSATPDPLTTPRPRQTSLDPDLTTGLSSLNLQPSSTPNRNNQLLPPQPSPLRYTPSPAPQTTIRTSLSLLEMLIRLTALQQFRQSSHLTIEDELLNFFLEDSATTGAGSNAEYRQRVRRDARRRVGFDPYDESPIKRRGEEYLQHPRSGNTPSRYTGAEEGETEYERGYREASQGWESVKQSIEYPGYFSGQQRSSSSMPSSPSLLNRERADQSPFPSRESGTPGKKGRKGVLRTKEAIPRSPLGRESPGS